MKVAGCLLLILAILSGCRQATEVPATRSQIAPLAPVKEQEQSRNSQASWPARHTELQHKLEQGHYQEVASEAEKAYSATASSERLWAWKFRLLQARATIKENQSKAALALLKMEPPPGLPIEDFVRKDIVFAEAMIVQKKPNDALAALNRVKPLLTSASINPVLNAEWLLWRGRCESLSSEAGQTYFQQAARLAHGNDKFIEASAEGNMGASLFERQHFDEAIDHLKAALVLAKEIDSPVRQEIALGYMSQSYFELGDYQKSEQYAHSSERLTVELGLIYHRMRRLVDIGRNEQNRGNYDDAMGYYLQAMSLARKDLEKKDGDKDDSNDVLARCLLNMADMELRRGNLDKVEDYSRQAALTLKADQALKWQVIKIDLALARQNYSSAEEMLRSLLAEKNSTTKDRWLAQGRMARLYELQGQANNADRWYRMALDTAVGASATLNHPEYKISLLSNLPFYNNYIEFLIRSNQPSRALQVAESGRAKVLAKASAHNPAADNATAWLSRIQNELQRSGKVVLAYWASSTQLYTWVVTPSKIQIVKQQYGSPELEKLVQSYQKEIELHNKLDECPAGSKLYQILVQPVQSFVPKGSHAIIVADASLYDINFESLIVTEPKPHYWIEDVELENAISVQPVTTASRQQSNYEKDLLAIGAPVQASQEFSLLPHAPDEIKLVTSTFAAGQQRVITAEQATPQAFFNSNPDAYRYIHFVAHGTNVALDPLESAIILSPDENHSYKLYARDIANLKRPIRAQVVTISSCNSAGSNTYEMGGLVGLSWAFTHAGAHQVVAALWKVDDATMPDLMGSFYREMAKGKSTSEALRDAKLVFLHSKGPRKRPYYWATLQLYTGS
jgi:CHAT domain-containing protein